MKHHLVRFQHRHFRQSQNLRLLVAWFAFVSNFKKYGFGYLGHLDEFLLIVNGKRRLDGILLFRTWQTLFPFDQWSIHVRE